MLSSLVALSADRWRAIHDCSCVSHTLSWDAKDMQGRLRGSRVVMAPPLLLLLRARLQDFQEAALCSVGRFCLPKPSFGASRGTKVSKKKTSSLATPQLSDKT